MFLSSSSEEDDDEEETIEEVTCKKGKINSSIWLTSLFVPFQYHKVNRPAFGEITTVVYHDIHQLWQDLRSFPFHTVPYQNRSVKVLLALKKYSSNNQVGTGSPMFIPPQEFNEKRKFLIGIILREKIVYKNYRRVFCSYLK